MFNPLVPDLSNLTDEELLGKIEELYRRGATLRAPALQWQLKQLINQYTIELDRRRSKQ